jgi:N-acetyl-gamma-glutamyl-phosphate reductase
MLDVAIAGATGYAGAELVRLLAGHPQVGTIIAASHSHVGKRFSAQFPNLRMLYGSECVESDVAALASQCDVLFLALPHGIATKSVTPEVLKQCVVIDLSADFRLRDPAVYEQWYKCSHEGRAMQPQAVYGLCELYRSTIAKSRLIANPGCYTTCSILTMAPLLRDRLVKADSIIIDAKSGVSGAGRSEKLDSLYCECDESIKPYGVTNHRHTPEIEQELALAASGGTCSTDVVIQFTPHLVPMNRGILATCYAKLEEGVDGNDIADSYRKAYGGERFVRLLGEGVMPETRWVKASNYCDIGYTVDARTRRVIACGALDNLVKGAAGQAVQNMNICCGFDEGMALGALPAFPL